jgi:hypothetical protein
MPLEQELAYYAENRETLLREYPERFVLIRGRELAGDYNSIEEAIEDGARRFGLSNFLVRKVARELVCYKITPPS